MEKNFLEKTDKEYSDIKSCANKQRLKLELLEKWVRKISCREYREELTKEEEEELKKDGLVLVFGASDDLCEVRGAISDEISCYLDKTVVYVEEIDGFVSEDYYKNNPHELIKIDLSKRPYLDINSKDGFWRYDISKNVLNLEFSILEDEKIYCVGKIFFKEDFKKAIRY